MFTPHAMLRKLGVHSGLVGQRRRLFVMVRRSRIFRNCSASHPQCDMLAISDVSVMISFSLRELCCKSWMRQHGNNAIIMRLKSELNNNFNEVQLELNGLLDGMQH